MMRVRPQIALTFHGIGTPPETVPEDERRYWAPEDEFAALVPELAQSAAEQDIGLLITFDDGNLSDLEIGAPVLRDHGLPGIFFPCAGRIGQAGYLGEAHLQDLIGQGFEIGSHGMDHVPWASLAGEALAREATGSRARLQELTGQQIATAALPFGSYNRRALAAARAAGYGRVYSSDPGLMAPGSWFIRRISYRQGIGFDLPAMLAAYAAPSHRIKAAIKHRIKALR